MIPASKDTVMDMIRQLVDKRIARSYAEVAEKMGYSRQFLTDLKNQRRPTQPPQRFVDIFNEKYLSELSREEDQRKLLEAQSEVITMQRDIIATLRKKIK